MTSIQILELDGSVELLVVLLPVDLEAKLCAGLEDEGNLVVCHARGQSGDVQNGFVKIRMRFRVVSDGHVEFGHRGCCRQKKRARRNRKSGERPDDLSLANTTHLPGCLHEIGRTAITQKNGWAYVSSASPVPSPLFGHPEEVIHKYEAAIHWAHPLPYPSRCLLILPPPPPLRGHPPRVFLSIIFPMLLSGSGGSDRTGCSYLRPDLSLSPILPYPLSCLRTRSL